MGYLRHLERLVGFDTRNPPRDLSADSPIFDYLRGCLQTHFDLDVTDHGDGCVSLFATPSGGDAEPRTLFNFHVDTVPDADGWTSEPLRLKIERDRAIGLGACDIKGASACMLAALDKVTPRGDVALLFTSDEEAGSSRCVKAFLDENETNWDLVVVAEPTRGRAILEHRGIVTSRGVFEGISGHASSGRADENSALHHVVRWSNAALEYASKRPRDIRLNLGHLAGGVKPNMIASHAEVWWGFRPLPEEPAETILEDLKALAPGEAAVVWQPGFEAPALPCSTPGRDVSARVEAARQKAAEAGLQAGEPVDFWTEAALFSSTGHDTIVFGPGNIARAHTADEWVDVAQLDRVTGHYARMLRRP